MNKSVLNPDPIHLLDYFGQSPIIIRSSSLLEDDFENSFAGKAESIILANQGSHNDRMIDFISAVQRVYASNMSEDVLKYRASRGLLERDEQMAILVQRVYAIARCIGEIVKFDEALCTMIIGPGRWGTTSPELGIPISFPEIKSVDVICEISAMHEYLVPDLSLGSHFFNELIETDILYFAIQPKMENYFVDYDFLNKTEICSEQPSPDGDRWKDIVRVIYSDKGNNPTFHFAATPEEQKAILYFE